jgi:branched-chain amino acid transport system permease protein
MLVAGYLLQTTLLSAACGRRAGPLPDDVRARVVIQNSLLQIFSPDVRSLVSRAGAVSTASWVITNDLIVPGLGLLIPGRRGRRARRPGSVPSHHRPGPGVRATAQDPDTAGRDQRRRVYARATAIAVARGAGGAFLAVRSTFDPASGPTQLIFAFEAVVIGGFGSLWGTLLGGIVLGVAQNLGALIDPQYAILAGHLVFLAVLASPRGGLLASRSSAS